MEESSATAEGGGLGSMNVRARHIKKRALKNKSLSVAFSEKDLKDFVGGFHKRKKKRRREAMQQKEQSERRKRIELRKKRKLEREFVVHGGAPPDSSGEIAESELDADEDDVEELPSVSGTTTYDAGDVQVMVTTSGIAKENESANDGPRIGRSENDNSKKKVAVIRKKLVSKAPQKRRSRPKPMSKRDKKLGKKKNVMH